VRLSSNLLLSCLILAAHPQRTLLSVAGVCVGVAAVVLMVSVGQGAEKRILDRIRSLGTNLIVVRAAQSRRVAGRERQSESVTVLTTADVAAIVEQCPSVSLATPVINKSVTAYWQSRKATTTVEGMTVDGFEIRNIPLATGRFFDQLEDRSLQRVAVVGPTVVEILFKGSDPVGQRFRIGRVPFEVVGVTARRGADAQGADQDDLIIIPLETAMRRLLNITYIHGVYVQVGASDQMDRAEQEIAGTLGERHRRRRPQDTFTIQNQEELIRSERETSRALTLMIGSVAGIALVVGGVGILAVMLMSVHERTREIGLRRAVGARRRDILLQFLLESVLLAGAGGLLGAGCGIGAAYGVAALGIWGTVLSWPSVAVGLGFSVSIGLVFGIYPALQAARLEPIEALLAA
jgi:putative ABC transport system permease protein